jgi:hypothetical protein
MNIIMDYDDNLARRIASYAVKNKKTFEEVVFETLDKALPVERTVCVALKPMTDTDRDEMFRVNWALNINRLYEAVQRLEVGQKCSFDYLLTPEQQRMTNRKKAAWRRALYRWSMGNENYTVTLLVDGGTTVKRNS